MHLAAGDATVSYAKNLPVYRPLNANMLEANYRRAKR
jgi:hypothetical protein